MRGLKSACRCVNGENLTPAFDQAKALGFIYGGTSHRLRQKNMRDFLETPPRPPVLAIKWAPRQHKLQDFGYVACSFRLGEGNGGRN